MTRLVQSERILRTTGVIIAVVGACYLGWLLFYGLDWAVWWLAFPVALANVQAYVSVLLFLFTVWHHDLTRRLEPLEDRSVDIFIATLNETYAVLAPTIIATANVRYPHTTYVLDDGRREWVRALCEQNGAVWVVRDDGRKGKGWNLRHGMEVSRAEFIVTLDADFVPAPWIVDHLLGFFADEDVALVQGPQIYYNTNSFQHARESDTWNDQTMFYEVVQPGKNHWNAAFWTGTPAMLRRSAVDQIGGIVANSLTEDIATTLALHQAGFRSVYYPGVVAVGLAPEDYGRFFNQRLRWTRGGIQSLRDQLLRKGGLTKGQFLSYLATMGRPWDVLRQLVLYLLPPVILVTHQIPIHPTAGYFFAFAVAHLTLLFGSVLLGRGTHRILRALVYDILWMAAALIAWKSLFEKTPEFRVTSKGRAGIGSGASAPLAWVIGLAAVYVCSIPFGLAWMAETDAERAAAVTLWTGALAMLFLSCAIFAVLHGRDSWRGVVVSEVVELSTEFGVVPARLQRKAVDRLQLWTLTHLPKGSDVVLTVDGSKLSGVVKVVRHHQGGFELEIDLLEPHPALAADVASALFAEESWPVTAAPVMATS